MTNSETPLVRAAVGVFQSETDLQAAVDDLLSHGFDRAELSILAPIHTVKEKLGHSFQSVTELEDDMHVPTMAFISKDAIGEAQGAVFSGLMYVGAMAALAPVVVSGGTLAAALIAVGIGGGSGGAIGAVLARFLGRHHATAIEEQLQRGGLLLWVRTWNTSDEHRAVEILSEHSGSDVHVHGLPERHPALEDRELGASPGAETRRYRGETYVCLGTDEYYVFGQVFPTESDAKASIDRHVSLMTLREDAKEHAFDLEEALADPARQFGTPEALMATSLSDTTKLEFLKRWAYSARQLEVASNEGMPSVRNGDRLQEINNIIVRLESRRQEFQ